MPFWNEEYKKNYHIYTKTYISSYKTKIDCADLAISALIDYAGNNKLPVKLKYYANGWNWMKFDPNTITVDTKNPTKAEEELKQYTEKFKTSAMIKLGALNVIDNTKPIVIGAAKAGDLIMSRWSATQGHTRIIYTVTPEVKDKAFQYKVIWYQGNLPPVIPEKRSEYFKNINGVFDSLPRRWNFDQFDK